MSESPTPGLVTPAWVQGLLVAAFSAEIPPVVAEFVDPAVCSRLVVGAKLGIVVGPNGAAVRVAHDDEAERLFALAVRAFPACAGWLSTTVGDPGALEGKDVYFETNGRSLRIFVLSFDAAQGAVGVWWQDGASGTVHPGQAPTGGLPGGDWFELRGGPTPRHLGVFPVDAEAVMAGRGGAALATVVAHYRSIGLRVAPWSLEIGPEGESVCAGGAHAVADASKLSEIFHGGAPTADVFAGDLARLVADADVDAARTLVAGKLYPALVDLKPAGTDLRAHLAEAWKFVVGSLSVHLPTERLAVLRQIVVANRLPTVYRDAYRLAVARYLARHPEATAPADLPDAVAALSEADIQARAEALLTEFEGLEAAALTDADFDVHRVLLVPFELPTIREVLGRAISGEFHGAEGPLHDYLVSLGTLGYDDDPSMIALEDVDLEPASRDAVLEEALARQDDDQG